MTRALLSLLLVPAVLALPACDREPGITTVKSAGPSLPDDTLRGAPPTATLGAQPAASAASASAQPVAAAPAAPEPVAANDLPAVRDEGDALGARLLMQRMLFLPVAGVPRTALSDNYLQGRGDHRHEAIDILAPAGTPVVAADDGRIAKLFTSKPGGLTVYQFDPQSQLAYYYAHLQGYADGLHEGMDVRRGDVIGYVGSTGNADARSPHLHFAVFRLGTPPKWWQGEAVNPYPALRGAQPVPPVASR